MAQTHIFRSRVSIALSKCILEIICSQQFRWMKRLSEVEMVKKKSMKGYNLMKEKKKKKKRKQCHFQY